MLYWLGRVTGQNSKDPLSDAVSNKIELLEKNGILRQIISKGKLFTMRRYNL